MTVEHKKVENKHRIVTKEGEIARTSGDGRPLDGGGFKTENEAQAKVRAINSREENN